MLIGIMENRINKKIVLAVCGASGVIYGLRLLKVLLEKDVDVFLVVSNAGKEVLSHEAGFSNASIEAFLAQAEIKATPSSSLSIYDNDDFYAPFASGSFQYDAMVVAPCTMGTMASIASGIANNLILRASDVCLKEKRPLILLPRETPFSKIHIENMLRLTEAGATIMPPSPSFYSKPKSIDDLVDTVVARVLDHLKIENDLIKRWG